MSNNTITFKCDSCGQELTFYRNTSDGHSCPVCDPLVYPILKPLGENIRGIQEVKATRELYKKQSKITLKEALESLKSKYMHDFMDGMIIPNNEQPILILQDYKTTIGKLLYDYLDYENPNNIFKRSDKEHMLIIKQNDFDMLINLVNKNSIFRDITKVEVIL